jgi:hypothetical protein
MASLRTVLMLSRLFPPGFGVGGKRVWRLTRYLPDFGWRAVVLTSPLPREVSTDPTAGRLTRPENRVVRRYCPDWWRRMPEGDSDGTVVTPTEARPAGLRQRLGRLLRRPLDRDAWLVPWIAWQSSQVARREGADALFVTSSPFSALLLGAAARAATGLPLCLDLRDPWSLNFVQQKKTPWVRASEAELERRLFHYAQRVTFTSEECVEAYRRRYPDLGPEGIRCVYVGYDPAQRPVRKPPAHGAVRLVHFGNLYGPRRIATVLRAMARIRDAEGPGGERLRLLNLGRMAGADIELVERLGLGDEVEARPFVPYEEGLRLLAEADLLLLLAYGEETLYVPSKVFDYFLAGGPMLVESQPSELTRMVSSTRTGHAIEPGDVDGAAAIIRRAMRARSDPATAWEPDPEAVERYSSRNSARLLAGILDEMVRGP